MPEEISFNRYVPFILGLDHKIDKLDFRQKYRLSRVRAALHGKADTRLNVIFPCVINHLAIVRERADRSENYIAPKLRDIA